jgi:ABC-type uncharacterized transport system substrate-binding protein
LSEYGGRIAALPTRARFLCGAFSRSVPLRRDPAEALVGDCTSGTIGHIRRMLRLPAILCLAVFGALPAAVAAHPHIFVDAGFVVERDAEGRPVAIEVTWRYDELYTLILLQDYGLDPDFDLVLTEAEVAETLGFDLNWSAGFEGGLVMEQGGQTLEIGAPEPVSLELMEPGQLQTTHRRPIRGAAPGDFTVQIYDPAFYIAFEMILPSAVRAAPACDTRLVRADLDAAYAVLEAAIEDIGGAVSAEDNFPPVGAYFADRVEVSCPG